MAEKAAPKKKTTTKTTAPKTVAVETNNTNNIKEEIKMSQEALGMVETRGVVRRDARVCIPVQGG